MNKKLIEKVNPKLNTQQKYLERGQDRTFDQVKCLQQKLLKILELLQ